VKYPLVCQPGTQWNYSMGPDVLSMLIERFSGMSTREFLMARIFKPLGMNETDYNVSKENQNRIFKLHTKASGAPIQLSANQPKAEGVTLWSGVNGLFTTAKDYSIFCQMLLNNGTWNGKQFLSRKTIELMTSNHVGDLFNRRGEGFGLGFAVVTDAAATQLPGSNGIYYWAGANNTHFFIDPKEKLIALFMTQESNFTWNYHDKLRQLVYQAVSN
jgi:CubicO group peptidase (beta-lactamase class C family)